MAPSSQEWEPPTNPAPFRALQAACGAQRGRGADGAKIARGQHLPGAEELWLVGQARSGGEAQRVRVADGAKVARGQHLPGAEGVWLVGEERSGEERKYHLCNAAPEASLEELALWIKGLMCASRCTSR